MKNLLSKTIRGFHRRQQIAKFAVTDGAWKSENPKKNKKSI
jgi:hypothetical protein